MLSHQLVPITALLIPLSGIAMIVAIVWFAHITDRRRAELRAELTRNLIDKFSTGEAFATAIQGGEGARILKTLSLEGNAGPKWVRLFVFGAVLAGLGLGFFVLASLEDDAFVIPGVICSSVGAGLLVSAYVVRRAGTRNGDTDGESDSRDLAVTDG